jgi:hypothetical protein
MALWLAREFDWITGRYTGNYYDIAEVGIVAVFVDSFYGDDTAAGTAAAPYKTLGKAITTLNSTGANGSRIFMNGIFSETLPTQTYWYEFIGCGGGRNGRTLISKIPVTNERVRFTKPLSRVSGVENINYEDMMIVQPGIGGFVYFNNCLLKSASYIMNTTSGIIAYNSIFKNFFFDEATTGGRMVNVTRCVLYNVRTDAISAGDAGLIGDSTYVSIDPSSNTITTSALTHSLVGGIPQFINPTDDDFSIRITSPLFGTGAPDSVTLDPTNIGGVLVGLPYSGLLSEFTTNGGATITDLTLDAQGRFAITSPAIVGTLETGLIDLGNIYPLFNINVFNIFDFASGEIIQGIHEDFVSPRMALTIRLKYGVTSAEVDECPWLLIEYGKQPTFSGTGASRVGNAAATFDPDMFQEITCRYMKLFITMQNNS